MDEATAWWAAQTPARRRLTVLAALAVLAGAVLTVAVTREPTAPVQEPRPAGTLVDTRPPAASTTTTGRQARATTTSVDPPMATSPATVPLPPVTR